MEPAHETDLGRPSLDQLRRHQFPQAGFGHRGLDEEAVREFRDHITMLLAAAIAENERIRNEPWPDTAPIPDSGGHGDKAARVLARAQENADRVMRDAQDQARETRQRAEKEAEQIVGRARQRAASARRESATAVAKLRALHTNQLTALDEWETGQAPATTAGRPAPAR